MKQLGENVFGFGSLFYKLQLLIEHVPSKHKELISWILSYTAEFHGSYDALIELSASTESSFSNLCQTRWCSIVEAIRYYLKWIKEIHAFLLWRQIILLNPEEIAVNKRLMLILEPIDSIINLFLKLVYISYYYPILTTNETHINKTHLDKIKETKALFWKN